MVDAPKINIVDVSAQRLTLRKNLEGIFNALHIVLDVSIIAYTVAENIPFEGNPELATLIRHHAMMEIDRQMRVVSRIVEGLGGKTEYTEDEEANVSA